MKRVLAFITAVVLAAALLPVRVTATTDLTFTVGSVNAVTRGGTVSIPVMVSNNTGFTAVGLVLTFNPNVLEITGVTPLTAQMPLNAQFALTGTPGTQWIHMVNTNLVDWYGNGPLLNINFTVSANAPLGASNIGLAFTTAPSGAPANANGDILHSAITIDGSITVIEPTPTLTSEPTPTPAPVQHFFIPIPATMPTPSPTPVPVVDTMPPAVVQNIFIGQAYTPAAQEAAVITPTAPATVAVFGAVPQTGAPAVTGIWIALGSSFFASVILWGRVIYVFKRKRNHG
ncbi:MAG: cohesin domain-containing protein [Defluviitaleaceae bacterium]|nr:cohesin domain-containing protein [Defluviitaleaceae bacterium]MCL2274804.1 cohesin domain-containing protein [Defluviitaleaceae bacterium]